VAERANSVWRTSPRSDGLAHQLDEELLLFDSLTWRTHLLNSTATELVRLLEQGVDSVIDLAEALAPDDASFQSEVEALLSGLLEIGLVERVQS
jgi:PqqD family protein of HPr-rel-A system